MRVLAAGLMALFLAGCGGGVANEAAAPETELGRETVNGCNAAYANHENDPEYDACIQRAYARRG